MKISVIINTYNEEKNLPYVLESVKDFDEVVVCDMYSTDRTVEIAKEYGCRVIYHEHTGIVEPARNYTLQAATYDWILTVDADEIVPPALKQYLYEKVNSGNCPAGIRIPRKNYCMGKFMRGAYPDYILRFFKKEGTFWSSTLHTPPVVEGIIETVPAHRVDMAFIHIADESIKNKVKKTNVYSEKALLKNKTYSIFSLLFSPLYGFIKQYLLKGGFRDGRPGLVFALFNSFSKFIVISKTWEKQTLYMDRDEDVKRVIKDL
ncbi:MAG: glycosyltransferase family 2 protein [Tannerellaceae bacterium]|nr:glycosyltransferase family 2 protein [Tannerellaceae bacterium]